MVTALDKLKYLLIDRLEGASIWKVVLNNPPANSLSYEMLAELGLCLDEFQASAEAKIMILAGSGERAFCAGADVNEIIKIKNESMGVDRARKGHELCNKIENSDKPVMAAIDAMCLGGGNELILACHIRVASERARFGQPEIAIGIIPGFGGTQRLARLVGPSRARKLILTGDTITAAEACEMGMIDEVVKKGMAVQRSIGLAKKMIKHSPISIKQTLRAIREGLRLPLDRALEKELECFGAVCRSEDMQEGLRAFKEKREPQYRGR